jgi:hypothetical protein
MKKILLTSVIALATVASFAQGVINVGNGINGTRFPIYGPQADSPGVSVVGNGSLSQPSGTTVFTGGLLSGDRYAIEFWAGPSSAVDFGGLTLITTTTFRTAATATALPNGITFTVSAAVPGVAAGLPAKLGVRVWDTQSGATYELAGVKAAGALFTSGPLGGVDGGGNLVLNPNWVGQSFSLAAVPEPSSMALAGLGAAALVLFRRRK